MTQEIPPQSPLNTPIPTELKERLMAYAAAEGRSQASAVRYALNDFLTRNGYPAQGSK